VFGWPAHAVTFRRTCENGAGFPGRVPGLDPDTGLLSRTGTGPRVWTAVITPG